MAEQLKLTFVRFTKDAYIVIEGKQNADRFFIINQGKVAISKVVEVVAEERGNVLGPGDFFGVVATMSSHNHIETAKALTDVVLISVHKDQYEELIQKNTSIAMKIILQFSKRLRYLDDALSRITLKNTAEATPSHLFVVAEYYLKQSRYNQAFYTYARYVKYCPFGEHVSTARERMAKIAIYAQGVKTEFAPDEFTRIYPKNSMLFAESEPGDELFIIRRGSVTISKIVDNNEVLLAVLKPGDIFGEMALLEAKPRAASAVAYEECQVLAVNRDNFERLIKTQAHLVARLTTLLAERIWFIDKQLANTLISDPIGRIYDALNMQLEKNRISPETQHSYTFDFGPRELANMVGLSQGDANLVLKKLLEDTTITIEKEKIRTSDVGEIVKQTEFYRKMQQIEKTRKDTRSTFFQEG